MAAPFRFLNLMMGFKLRRAYFIFAIIAINFEINTKNSPGGI